MKQSYQQRMEYNTILRVCHYKCPCVRKSYTCCRRFPFCRMVQRTCPYLFDPGQSCRVHDLIGDLRYSRRSGCWEVQRKNVRRELSTCRGRKSARISLYDYHLRHCADPILLVQGNWSSVWRARIAFSLFHTGKAVVMLTHDPMNWERAVRWSRPES
jgi:hypothetical protein